MARSPRKTSRKSKKSTRSSKNQSFTSQVKDQFERIPDDRKRDIGGIFIILFGALSLTSLITKDTSSISAFWADFLINLLGFGAWLLSFLLVLIGIWLVLRNLERIPVFNFERGIGLFFLFSNLIFWAALFFSRGSTFSLIENGGGSIGNYLYDLLLKGFGLAAVIVILIAWLLIGLILFLNISLADMLTAISSGAQNLFEQIREEREKTRASEPEIRMEQPEIPENLPSEYKSMETAAAMAKGAPAEAVEIKETPVVSKNEPVLEEALYEETEEQLPSVATPNTGWKLPELDEILDTPSEVIQHENIEQEIAHLIEDTLKSFGVPGRVVDIKRGPTITRYGLEPDFIETRNGRTRVRVSKITSLADDLALALAAPRIRMQAPVPGKSFVGIEVPNKEPNDVTLYDVIESQEFKNLRTKLKFGLGKDVSGNPVSVDLTKLPHLLIAGTTGSGKSVCINAILSSFLLKNTPEDLRLVLVDPKRVELTGYNGIPHLLSPTITDAEKVINALQWMTREMDSRYHKFSKTNARNIQQYNRKHPDKKIPYLVIIIDELADLMMLAPDETERTITRLAQLARATGIHLILATQRPSTDVVTGLIKANFPARIAFAVASGVDSRVILDQPGAERLLGKGDMLYQAPDASAPERLQGVYVSDVETNRLVDYWIEAARAVETKSSEIKGDGVIDLPTGAPLKQNPLFDESPEQNGDKLLPEAIDLVRREGRASITMLQRKLRIGYTRAARLIDAMEEKKIISPVLPHTNVREILDYGPTAPPRED